MIKKGNRERKGRGISDKEEREKKEGIKEKERRGKEGKKGE